jgi:DNA topoisomerase-1
MLILRQGKHPNFSYVNASGNRITNGDILSYIKGLVIPPKYTDVKIHISIQKGTPCEPLKQTYTGIDDKGRTQYGYSNSWKEKSKKSKYLHLVSFGKALPKIRTSISATLKKGMSPIPTLEMNIALIIHIIMSCHFRLGNLKYKNMYKSYGITNIEVRHIKFNATSVKISFIGKKGVKNDCIIEEKWVISMLKNIIKGKTGKDPVFTYNAGGDCTERVRATDINEWMKKFGTDITSKMFRTFATNIMLIELLREMDEPETQNISQRKRTLNSVLDDVSGAVHNTRAVCKKEYTHPGLIKMYIEHPRRFKSKFMGTIDPEPAFLSYLRST